MGEYGKCSSLLPPNIFAHLFLGVYRWPVNMIGSIRVEDGLL
jgi:hypothetical protein